MVREKSRVVKIKNIKKQNLLYGCFKKQIHIERDKEIITIKCNLVFVSETGIIRNTFWDTELFVVILCLHYSVKKYIYSAIWNALL